MTTHDFTLSRNAFGKLVLTAANGDFFEGVVPVRTFPIGAPDDGIALANADGQELAWIMRRSDLTDTLPASWSNRSWRAANSCLKFNASNAPPTTTRPAPSLSKPIAARHCLR